MISKYSVKRPYTVLVGVILVIVLGVVSYMKMTADLLPDMTFPYVIVVTTDPGAGPEEVETNVTSKLEATLATTSNLKSIQSMSYNSYSMIILEYEQTSNMDSTIIEIQQKVDQLKGVLPDAAGAPMLMQINPNMLAIMVAAVSVEGKEGAEVKDYVDREIIPQLESVEGVAAVNTSGGIVEEIEITLNQDKIDKLNDLVMNDIEGKFTEAQDKLDESKEQIESGKEALSSGSSELVDQISQGSTMLNDQKMKLYTAEAEMASQRTTLETMKTLLETILTQLKSANDKYNTLQSEISELNARILELEGIKQIYEAAQAAGEFDTEEFIKNMGIDPAEIDAAIESLREQIRERTSALDPIREQIQVIRETFGETFNNYDIELGDVTDLSSAIGALEERLTEIKVGLATMDEAKNQIDAGKTTIDEAITALNKGQMQGVLTLSQSSAQLSDGEAALTAAQTQIDQAKEQAKNSADVNAILSADTIKALITAQNFDMPAGNIEEEDGTYLITVGEKVKTLEALQDLVLINLNMDHVKEVRLSDVADVVMVDNKDKVYAKVNGEPGLLLSFEKQTGYATGDVTDSILDRFKVIENTSEIPVQFATLMDQGVYIDMIVDSVVKNMIVGALLAILVLAIFLKDLRPTVIIGCAIPLSVIFALVLMYFSGISLNIISMSGLALGIGMLVDNSIVVIENIYRLRAEGQSIKKACVYGASQVAGAITASTLTTVCVFAPIVFVDGITKQLFVDMGLTIAYTLFASLLVALTLVPAMAQGVLKKSKEKPQKLLDKFLNFYGKFLGGVLRVKWLVFIVMIGLLGLSVVLELSRGTAFFPSMTSTQMTVTLSEPEDVKMELSEMTAYSDTLVERLMEIEDIETIGAMAGSGSSLSGLSGSSSNSITMYVLLKEDTKTSNEEMVEKINAAAEGLGCEVSVNSEMMDMSAMSGSGITVNLKGRDLEVLQEMSINVAEKLTEVDGLIDIDNGQGDLTKEIEITVDKEKAAKYGMTVAQVFQLVYGKTADATSSAVLSTDVKDYKIYVKSAEQAAMSIKDLKKITFDYTDKITNETEEVKLADIVTFEEKEGLSSIRRKQQTRYISVSAAVDEDHNVGLVSQDVVRRLSELEFPEGYSYEMAGEDEMINEAMEQLGLMLILALILIYLIMVAQFQSLLSPFIIMFTIPLAFTGGFLSLYFTKSELSIIAMIGFVMLSGIIVNNGIVLVDYINQLRREGWKKKDAIIESSKTRLRPVLMTALTTIISMSTMAIGMGMGTEMARPMAIVVVGGMIYGTLLTLIVVPCIYDALNREKDMREENLDELDDVAPPVKALAAVGEAGVMAGDAEATVSDTKASVSAAEVAASDTKAAVRAEEVTKEAAVAAALAEDLESEDIFSGEVAPDEKN